MECEQFLNDAMSAHGGTVYRLALCRTQNAADAEDVYQEVFLSLISQAQAEEWTPEHLKAWLIRCAVNRCNDIHRSFWQKRTLPLDSVPEIEGETTRGQAELWDAVAGLPPRYRVAIHLFYAEGYSTEEISRLQHISPSTARSRLHRARNLLKKALGGNEDEK